MRQFSNKPVSDFDKSFDTMQTIFKVVFGLAVVMIIGSWIVMGVFAYKTIDAVGEQGVKGVVEQVWCGKDTQCSLPAIAK